MMSMLDIREMTEEDAGWAAKLECQCFAEPWTEEALREMIQNPLTIYLAAFLEGEPVGYCGCQVVLDEGDILRIAVDGNVRGKGIGSAILEKLWQFTPQVQIWNLDVRESNSAAQKLYRKYDFEWIGKRKNYYHKPLEDALTMQRNVSMDRSDM
ncbi:MAG: ribosomal protein S18-alanine N-acetyltransferase [Clostridiales bacterium]|nr:ribosomal protein S18-alanine N-acetyltransferase [Clostridiales bacterium]